MLAPGVAGSLLWQAQVVNAWGKAERQTYGNGVNTVAAFDPASGRTTALTAGLGTATNVLNHAYVWDSLDNLLQRHDANGDAVAGAVSETFRYDDGLNRLTGYTVSAPAVPGTSRSVTLQYNVLGQLLYKSDVGVYGYGASGPGAVRPHALQSVTDSAGATTAYTYDANGNLVSASAGKYRSLTYTSFNLPDSNSGAAGPGGSPRYTWQYDENHARLKEVRVTGAGTRTTWYLHPDNAGGLGFESETSPGGALSQRHYISAGGQAIGVLVSTAALPAPTGTAPPAISSIALVKVEYWHKDHLGSLAATTDHAGTVTGRYAYDPFGKRRHANGSYDAAGNLVIDWSPATHNGTDRGFTGHEHLDDIGLVHMNGRIFDATLGVFLQADPLIQNPNDLQNYHRYGYCLNNPLTCTDPTGYWSLKKTLNKAINKVLRFGYELSGLRMVGLSFENYRIASSIAAAVALGPAGGAVASGWSAMGQAAMAGFVSGTIASGTISGGVQGAFSAAMFFGAGNVIGGGNFFTGGVDKAAAWGKASAVALHGVVGCVTSVAGGGKCGPGALSAAFSKAAQVGGLVGGDPIRGTIMSAAVGGTASVLGGGKFANGARTGAFSYVFNFLGHCQSTAECMRREGYKETNNGDGTFCNIQGSNGACGFPGGSGSKGEPMTVQFGVGGQAGGAVMGVSLEVGVALPTTLDDFCIYVQACGVAGPQIVLSANAAVSLGQGQPSTGTQGSKGLTWFGGDGVVGSVQMTVNADGQTQGTRGVVRGGVGAGAGAGFVECGQATACIKR